MRLFVALELDEGLRRALVRSGEELAKARGGLRVLGIDAIHLTVRFVGEVESGRSVDVIDAAREAAEAVAPFEVELAGLSGFPKPRAARVLYSGVEPSRPLATLAGRVEQALRDRGFPPDGRRFTAHVTLARARGRPVDLGVEDRAGTPRFGKQEFSELTVFESVLSPRGSTYVSLARVGLSESGAPDRRAAEGLEGRPEPP